LGCPSAAVATDTGFYDLGLDSVGLLRLGEELESVAGAPLYPTLLFEHGDIDSLARHLVEHYPVRVPDAQPAVVAEPAAPGVAACRVPVWVDAAPAGSVVRRRELVAYGVAEPVLAAWRSA